MKNALLAIRNAIVIVSLLRQQRFLLVSVCKRDNPSRSENEGFGRIVIEKDARISTLEKQSASLENRLTALEKLVADMTTNQTGSR